MVMEKSQRSTIPEQGFTLVELLITVVILGILLGLGVPAFSDLIKNNRLTTAANTFVASVNFARSEAVKRGEPVLITAADSSAAGNEWGPGWTVWLDSDGDSTLDAGEELREVGAIGNNITVDSNGDFGQFTYDATGLVDNGNTTLDLCDDRNGERGRQITISNTGSVTTADLDC